MATAPRQEEPAFRYESDFDFESANARFNKEDFEEEFRRKLKIGERKEPRRSSGEEREGSPEVEEVEEEEEGEIVEENGGGEGEEFYDKSKSFFDNISCEANTQRGNR